MLDNRRKRRTKGSRKRKSCMTNLSSARRRTVNAAHQTKNDSMTHSKQKKKKETQERSVVSLGAGNWVKTHAQ